jgi:tetratricopeptide (TPR) repeat protein
MRMAEMAVEREAERTSRQSRGRWVLLLAVVAGALICGGWKLWELRRYRRAMAEIKQEIQAGRHGHAVRKLVTLSAWKPDSDEAAYLLGVCEKARGQAQPASQAWERVAPGSPFGARAIRGRMELLIERGRLADAETLIIQTMSDPRIDGSGLRLFLGLIYSLQGRVEEGERVIEACWDRLNEAGQGASELAILLVRLHIQLRRETPSVETVRSFLDQVAQAAPKDDRVWLGKAKLAIRVASYDEAAQWLDACLRRRPDDIPVWRARLDWALATHRLADVRQALGHLPVKESTPAQIQTLTAWLAAFRGDLDLERRALERLFAVDPTDFAAYDRLVAIAEKQGKADRAIELRRQKTEIDRLLARYEKLDKRNQTMRDAPEMASLAERLGRPFEAKVLETIAIATDPDHHHPRDQLIRPSQDVSTTNSLRSTLADLLAQELDAAGGATTR